MRPEAEQRCPSNQETKMLIWTKFALCAAIVLSTAATASAATKKKTTAHRSGVSVQTSVPRPAPLVNPYSPAATGGGTPVRQQNLQPLFKRSLKYLRDCLHAP